MVSPGAIAAGFPARWSPQGVLLGGIMGVMSRRRVDAEKKKSAKEVKAEAQKQPEKKTQKKGK